MAEAVVSSVVQKLGDWLIQEAKFLHGVSGKVELMQTELKLMQSYLEDADKRLDEDKRLQTWISEIREAAYDAEDAIDTFALRVASRRRGGIQNAIKRYSCVIGEAAEIREVGYQIEAITAKISTLKSSLETYGINHTSVGEGSSSAYERQRLWRQPYAHVVEEFTVGLDRDVEILAEQLVKEERHCDVVSIWGMGGLGKTTLAKKAYRDSKIRRHFDAFAWVYVSQQTQQREIWEGILSELISASDWKRQEIKGWRNEKLAENLFQVQQNKKCLVILDDIWTNEAWDSLKSAFPLEKSGSKLLLTTRNREVAPHVDPNAFIHELKLLNEEESWELFKKKAFPREDDPGSLYITYSVFWTY